MSMFVDEAVAASEETEDILGESFTLSGKDITAGTFMGVFSERDERDSPEEGGRRVLVSASIEATKAQFVTAGIIPARKHRVVFDGVPYRVTAVLSDEATYRLTLEGLDQ